MTDPIRKPSTGINTETKGVHGLTPEQFNAMKAENVKNTNLNLDVGKSNNNLFGDIAGASVSALTEIPNIVAATSADSSALETNRQARKAITAKTVSLASSGASIGGTIGSLFPGAGNVIGTLAGGVIGGVAGQIGANKLINEVGAERSAQIEKKYKEQEDQDLRDYYKNNSSEKMEATLKLLKEQQGLFDT